MYTHLISALTPEPPDPGTMKFTILEEALFPHHNYVLNLLA